MARKAPGSLRSIWLLARLRLLRRLNWGSSAFSRSRFRANQKRAATPAKARTNWFVALLVLSAMIFTCINMTRQTVAMLHAGIDLPRTSSVAEKPLTARARAAADLTPGTRFSAPLARSLALEIFLLVLTASFAALAAREVTKADWDMEWLITLPVQTSALLWGRILERSLSDGYTWVVLAPACGVIAWYAGHGWAAPLTGVLSAFAVAPLAALGHTLVDTGLRLSLSPAQLRNLQAIISIAAAGLLMLVMSAGFSVDIGMYFAQLFPEWAMWTPPGLIVRTINAANARDALASAALLVGQVAVALIAGVGLLRFQLRNGIVAAGSRDSHQRTALRAPRQSLGSNWPKSPVQWRELVLLRRDRNFLVQTFVLPLLMVIVQAVANGQLSAMSTLLSSVAAFASIAFGVAAYSLLFSAMQTLNAEGGALWLLYSFPLSIERVLKEKARLWGLLALVYPALIIGFGAYYTHDSIAHVAGHAVMALVGVPIFSAIAVSLGIFASDPLAVETSKRLHPAYIYLYLLLSGIYIYAIALAAWWQSMAFAILAALLALALWQKARDELPFLLDPAASPPSRVSTSDGLIAAMVFFVLQIVIGLLLHATGRNVDLVRLLVAFACAGGLTYLIVRVNYWRMKTQAVPVLFDGRLKEPLRFGVLTGIVAGAIGLAYALLAHHFDLFSNVLVRRPADPFALMWFVFVAVAAAPLFEEFIFRGLIFGGLRRSFGIVPGALASAAVFAIVHPLPSMLPVFVLGVCAAFAYERSGTLLAPIATHALYNAIVLGYQLASPFPAPLH